MLKRKMTSPLQYPLLRKIIFTMYFLLNVSFLLPLITLTFLFSFFFELSGKKRFDIDPQNERRIG